MSRVVEPSCDSNNENDKWFRLITPGLLTLDLTAERGGPSTIISRTDSKGRRAVSLSGKFWQGTPAQAYTLSMQAGNPSTTTPFFQLEVKYDPLPRAHFTLSAQPFSSTPSDRQIQLAISPIREPSALSSAG